LTSRVADVPACALRTVGRHGSSTLNTMRAQMQRKFGHKHCFIFVLQRLAMPHLLLICYSCIFTCNKHAFRARGAMGCTITSCEAMHRLSCC
jgi:hypothetical protein